MMYYFDTHAHLGLIIDDPIEQMIVAQEAKRDSVVAILSVCNNLLDFFTVYKNLSLASHVYHAVGVSPSEVEHPGHDWETQIAKGVTLKNVVAIGETGLDYYRVGSKDKQIELFIKQLEMAERFKLPAIIHNREAGKDILDILKTMMPSKGVVLHCFSEDWDFAQKALNISSKLLISFAGNVTYRNAKKLQEAAYHIPLANMLVESESPFMIPTEYRDRKRTRPSYIHSTVDFIAQIRNEDVEYIASNLYHNACKIFNISAKDP